MARAKWDYGPLKEDSAVQYELFAAVVAHCQCGKTLTAVSNDLQTTRARIKAKYRDHARKKPTTHPIPREVKKRARPKAKMAVHQDLETERNEVR